MAIHRNILLTFATLNVLLQLLRFSLLSPLADDNESSEQSHAQFDDNVAITSDNESSVKQINEQSDDNVEFMNGNEIAIFYHGYISPEDRNGGHAVISEQFDQIIRAADKQQENRTFHLYINMIGYSDNTTKTMIDAKCEHIECINVNHYASGFEELTLDQLANYCKSDSNHDKRVVYLHSKGTYHAEAYQAEWRRALTEAALDEKCLDPPTPECNLCGLTFEPFWTMFIGGNMWTAECSYISELYPIHQFSEMTEKLKKHADELGYIPQFASPGFLRRGDIYGLGRYALEHWVGTHPDIRPCVQATYTEVPLRFLQKVPHTNFNWTMFPREHQTVETPWTGSKERHKFDAVLKSRILRWREYQFLPGYILKWQTLYGKIPDNASWVWDFYPDGHIWKAALAIYGDDTLEKAIEVIKSGNNAATKKRKFNLKKIQIELQKITKLKEFQEEVVQKANLQ